ncbi:YbhN family protein [Pontibacter silvestris]|uniref:YbhN family protein n=1 Tax=Pontibacter silvestris TaxID=2305183 RepID=A0ABW4X0I3_9BACT|nr:lysylphosphatidylglycerol synthase transmembrane domain-containing protein [Pontibacter silvestris]MCC9135988.1 flippase-like domain-containing protein [Pontibacter silvestris]
MALTQQKLQEQFSVRNILLPLVLGLGVIGYMLYQHNEPGNWQTLLHASPFWISMALFVLFVRDFGYMYRIRHITDKALSWRQSFHVIMLWEFASCMLPSVVGGSTVATYILYKEKIPLGKSLAQVMVTAMLDNFYFILAVPLVLIFTQGQFLPEMIGLSDTLRHSLSVAFVISYVMVALYASIMFYALFMNPRGIKHLLLRIGRLKPFRRWSESLFRHANELLIASKHLRHKSSSYWWRAIISTMFVWTARYIIIGCLIAAFTHLNLYDHLLIFSRNLIYKIVLFVSITPGAAGIAELAFPAFFGSFVGGLTTIVVLFYRLLTHYLYLVVGAIIFPRWMANVFKHSFAGEQEQNIVPVLTEHTIPLKPMAVQQPIYEQIA